MTEVAAPAVRLGDLSRRALELRCEICAVAETHSVPELQRFYGWNAEIAILRSALVLRCGHQASAITPTDTEDHHVQAKPRADSDAAIDAVLAEFGGDPRAAIGALLYDLDALAADATSLVSRGYVRGRDIGVWRRLRLTGIG